MAISIPIVTELDAKGIDRAVREFKKLETAGEKAQFAISKAAVPAAAALGVLVNITGDSIKAFAEDEKAATALAATLTNVTGATDKQVAAVESFITKTSFAVSVADDQLRPALASLVTATGDVTKAQELLNLALDISAGTGKDLGSVSEALGKAFNGQLGPLKKLDPALTDLIKNGASTDEIFKKLSETFKGQASEAAGTTSGRMENLKIRMDEMKESIGQAVVPIVEKLMPAFTAISDWASKHTSLIVGIGIAVAGIAAAILIANAGLAAWNALTIITAAVNAVLATSFDALWIATGVGVIIPIIAAVVILQAKFNVVGDAITGVRVAADWLWQKIKDTFNWVVNNWPLLIAIIALPFTGGLSAIYIFKDKFIGILKSIVGFTVDTFKSIADAIYQPFKTVFNGIADLWNSTVGALSFTVPSWIPLGLGGKTFDVPDIPTLGNGGIVTSPTLALIGESGPEAVVPLNGSNGGMGGNTINITVTSADPNAVVAALQSYVRMSGPVPLNTRTM